MLVDDEIQTVKKIIDDLENKRIVEQDADKKYLYGALKKILRFTLTNLTIFYCKELQQVDTINYVTKQKEKVTVTIDRHFMDRSIRRILLLDSWSQFELYFSKKVTNSEKLITSKIVSNYFAPKIEPDVIKFFRETRNSIHNNGTYNRSKMLKITIDGKAYTLSQGKEVNFADYGFLIDVIGESLKLI